MSGPAIVPDPTNGPQNFGQEFTVDGVTYRAASLTIEESGELLAWVLRQLPDRLAIAKKMADGLPEVTALQVVQAAIDDVCERPIRLGSEVAQALLATPEGFVEMMFLRGRKHQPTMTRDDWAALLEKVMEQDRKDLEAKIAHENEGGALADPKRTLLHDDPADLVWLFAERFHWTPEVTKGLSIVEARALIQRIKYGDALRRQRPSRGF